MNNIKLNNVQGIQIKESEPTLCCFIAIEFIVKKQAKMVPYFICLIQQRKLLMEYHTDITTVSKKREIF